jgi:cyanophycin synthetase
MSIKEQYPQLQMTALRICEELESRQVEFEIIEQKFGTIRFKKPGSSSWSYTISSLSEKNKGTAQDIANKKSVTSALCKILGVKIPQEVLISDSQHADIAIDQMLGLCAKIVVKPLDSAHGNGVSIGITNHAQAQLAYTHARKFSDNVLIQEHVEGFDIRVITVGGVYTSAITRISAYVIGDGQSSIAKLIEKENANILRSDNFSTSLPEISLSEATNFLGEQINQTPAKNINVQVVGPANLSLGGTIEDYFLKLPQEIAELSIHLANEIGLTAAAIDYMVTSSGQYYLIETNAKPSLYMHQDPDWGINKPVITKYVDAILR